MLSNHYPNILVTQILQPGLEFTCLWRFTGGSEEEGPASAKEGRSEAFCRFLERSKSPSVALPLPLSSLVNCLFLWSNWRSRLANWFAIFLFMVV